MRRCVSELDEAVNVFSLMTKVDSSTFAEKQVELIDFQLEFETVGKQLMNLVESDENEVELIQDF